MPGAPPARRHAKNAAAPIDQSREAHHSVRPLHAPRGASRKVYRRQFRFSGCHRLIHPNVLVLLDALSPAEMEPEVGFEPTTFRLRGDSKPESRRRLVKVVQLRQGAWQSSAILIKQEHRPRHRPWQRTAVTLGEADAWQGEPERLDHPIAIGCSQSGQHQSASGAVVSPGSGAVLGWTWRHLGPAGHQITSGQARRGC